MVLRNEITIAAHETTSPHWINLRVSFQKFKGIRSSPLCFLRQRPKHLGCRRGKQNFHKPWRALRSSQDTARPSRKSASARSRSVRSQVLPAATSLRSTKLSSPLCACTKSARALLKSPPYSRAKSPRRRSVSSSISISRRIMPPRITRSLTSPPKRRLVNKLFPTP
jgi:hypothetical protein